MTSFAFSFIDCLTVMELFSEHIIKKLFFGSFFSITDYMENYYKVQRVHWKYLK